MKKAVVLLILTAVMGLWGMICWEENGKAIRQETNLNFEGSVISLENGELLLMWSDAASGEQEMKIQKITAEGEFVWDNPRPLTTRECYYPGGGKLIESTGGDVIAVWYELGDPSLVRLQRIDTDGERLWGDAGVIIDLGQEMSCFDLEIISDGGGGVYVIWEQWMGETIIKATRLNEAGEVVPGWLAEGKEIMTGDMYFSATGDGYGGIVVVSNYYQDLKLQRCNSQGTLCWGSEGISIANEGDFFREGIVLPWGEGEYAFVVETMSGILVNTVNYNGELLLPAMQTFLSSESEVTGKFQATVSSDDKLVVVCEYIAENCFLRMQKGAIGESLEWGEEGILVFENEEYGLFSPLAAPDAEGGVYLSWMDYLQAENSYEMYYQHYDNQGNPCLGNDPQLLCNICRGIYGGWINGMDFGSMVMWSMDDNSEREVRMQIFDHDDIAVLEENGRAIHSVLAGTTRHAAKLVSNGGRTAICWEDERSGISKVYMQMIDNESGECLFEENGIAATVGGIRQEEEPRAGISEDGDLICAVYLSREVTEENWFVQLFDEEGERLLGDSGQQLNDDSAYDEIVISDTGDNGMLIVWQEWDFDIMEPNWTIKAQKLTSDGMIWDDGITLASDTSHDNGQIAAKEDKVSWVEYIWGENELRVISLEDDGSITPGWSEDGILIAEHFFVYSSQLYKDGENTVILWESRETETGNRNLYAQIISDSGDIMWESGGRIICENCSQLPSYEYYNDSFYIVKQQIESGLSLTKCDLQGNELWAEAALIDDNSNCWRAPITFYEDKVIVYWQNEDNDIYAKVFNDDGTLIENIPVEGLIVCDQQHEQEIESCITDGVGNSIVLWEDKRGEYLPEQDPSLYVQKIDLSLVAAPGDEVPEGDKIHLSNYPNPFLQNTTLKYELPRGVLEAEIVIYNIKGQKVRELPINGGKRSVEWDCHNEEGKLAGAGIYFYRLQGEGIESCIGRMIMLR